MLVAGDAGRGLLWTVPGNEFEMVTKRFFSRFPYGVISHKYPQRGNQQSASLHIHVDNGAC